jgi:hypothetical protein
MGKANTALVFNHLLLQDVSVECLQYSDLHCPIRRVGARVLLTAHSTSYLDVPTDFSTEYWVRFEVREFLLFLLL